MSVKTLQKQFVEFIYQNKNAESLSEEILSASFEDSMAIYRKHVWHSLINTLKIHYGSVLSILGEDIFFKLAQSYVLENPSKTPDLELYGHDFSDFLQKNKNVPEYLQDIATLDIAYVKSAIAPDFIKSSITEFQSIKPQDYENIIFITNPTNIICNLKYDVQDVFENPTIDPVVRKLANIVLVSRDSDNNIQHTKINPSDKKFLELSNQQQKFFDIFEELTSLDKDFNLQKTLSTLIEKGFIIGFVL